MKKWYFDLTLLKQCTGILAGPGTEVIPTGTRIHTEDERYRNSEPALRLEREKDLHFWFGEAPRIDIYTVPQMELGGYDSRGGFLAGSRIFPLGQGSAYTTSMLSGNAGIFRMDWSPTGGSG